MKVTNINKSVAIGLLVLLVLQQQGNAQQLPYGGPYANPYPAPYAALPYAAMDFPPTQGQGEGPVSRLEIASRERLAHVPVVRLQKARRAGRCCLPDCCANLCCRPTWQFFGQFLYLRPSNAEVVYGVPFNGPITPANSVPIQVGALGVVDPDHQPGFSVGFTRALSERSNFGATYTHFESNNTHQINTAAPIVIRSMVIHPSSANASTNWLSASASHDISFNLVDLDYRRVFACGERYVANYLVGARYGQLDQSFRSRFTDAGVERVNTDISFEGGGIRVGLEAERRSKRGFIIYGKTAASFVAGQFHASYFQGNDVDLEIVNTHWRGARVVPMLDIEFGIGWMNSTGRFRINAGYVFSSWLNVPKTDDLIQAVQGNNFANLADGSSSGSGMTFDGLAVRTEVRW